MNRGIKILIVTLVILLIPITISAAVYWSGKDYHNANEGEMWGVTHDSILKIENPGRAYNISDIGSYSAYVTNNPAYVGNKIENTFYWFNKSRLAYIKLFKVNGGQSVSFLFDKSIYLYCAEFDKDYVLINDGRWGTNGTRYTLMDNTAWIVVVFRQVNGDLSDGSGLELEIASKDVLKGDHHYILFEPFKYELNLNGGRYMGTTETIEMERLGVEKITLPTPTRSGYTFGGWKSKDGKIYNGTLDNVYDAALFKDTSFNAIWNEVGVSEVKLDREYVILEQNSGESYSLKVKITPDNALNKSITFTSSDTNVAKVDSNGKITAGKTGVATVTAKSASGAQAVCMVYVMGFNISIPSGCSLNQAYEINVSVYNNGSRGMTGRKKVILDADGEIELVRVGDEDTSYSILAESSTEYNTGYSKVGDGYLVNTEDSTKVYYRLKSEIPIEKAGDYEGNITFTVAVK